jgi:hypothetical protein
LKCKNVYGLQCVFYRSPLKGQPIETPAPAEARKQPTPTAAVMAVLKKQGEDTTPSALVPGVTNAVLRPERQSAFSLFTVR